MLRFVALLALVCLTAAYPSGAPDSTCQNRRPGHDPSKVKDEACPFIFTGVPWTPGEFVDGKLTFCVWKVLTLDTEIIKGCLNL